MYKKQYIFAIDFIANSSVLCGCLELKLCFMPVVINMLYLNIFLLIALISEAIAKTVLSGTSMQHSFPVQKLLSNVEFRTLKTVFGSFKCEGIKTDGATSSLISPYQRARESGRN